MLDRRFIALILFVVLVSCSKGETTTAAAPRANPPAENVAAATPMPTQSSAPPPVSAAAPTGIATADGETAGVTATIKELKRSSGGTLSLKFTIVNSSPKKMDIGYTFVDPSNEVRDFGSFGGVHLIDPVGKKKYFVARDAGGKCVCSQGVKDVPPGESINVWAKFPAPPDDVEKISVVIPHFSPLDDVPISK